MHEIDYFVITLAVLSLVYLSLMIHLFLQTWRKGRKPNIVGRFMFLFILGYTWFISPDLSFPAKMVITSLVAVPWIPIEVAFYVKGPRFVPDEER